MKNKLFFLLCFSTILFNLPFVLAQEELNVDISFDIITRQFRDAFVVGDSFFYNITFNNTSNNDLNTIIKVSVFNPQNILIEDIREYNLTLKQNTPISIVAKGGKENEDAAFLFQNQGSYKIVVESNKIINFYLRTKVFIDVNGYYDTYIRFPQKIEYTLDVMPRWQYDLWKDNQKANQKIIEANEKLLEASSELLKVDKIIINLTSSLNRYTIALFGLTFILVLSVIADPRYGKWLKILFISLLILFSLIATTS